MPTENDNFDEKVRVLLQQKNLIPRVHDERELYGDRKEAFRHETIADVLMAQIEKVAADYEKFMGWENKMSKLAKLAEERGVKVDDYHALYRVGLSRPTVGALETRGPSYKWAYDFKQQQEKKRSGQPVDLMDLDRAVLVDMLRSHASSVSTTAGRFESVAIKQGLAVRVSSDQPDSVQAGAHFENMAILLDRKGRDCFSTASMQSRVMRAEQGDGMAVDVYDAGDEERVDLMMDGIAALDARDGVQGASENMQAALTAFERVEALAKEVDQQVGKAEAAEAVIYDPDALVRAAHEPEKYKEQYKSAAVALQTSARELEQAMVESETLIDDGLNCSSRAVQAVNGACESFSNTGSAGWKTREAVRAAERYTGITASKTNMFFRDLGKKIASGLKSFGDKIKQAFDSVSGKKKKIERGVRDQCQKVLDKGVEGHPLSRMHELNQSIGGLLGRVQSGEITQDIAMKEAEKLFDKMKVLHHSIHSTSVAASSHKSLKFSSDQKSKLASCATDASQCLAEAGSSLSAIKNAAADVGSVARTRFGAPTGVGVSLNPKAVEERKNRQGGTPWPRSGIDPTS